MTKQAIYIEQLQHRYEGQWQLNIPSLSLAFGKIYGLIGRNGAGKSSLMRLISGDEVVSWGRVNCGTEDIGHVSNETTYPSYYRISDLENLFQLKAQHANKHWDKIRFDEIADLFNVTPSTSYKHLSTGQKAGLNLAIMLAQRPKIWLLDEPTLGIDIIAVNQCLSVLGEYFADDEPCVLFSTHHMNELERMADEVLILSDGHISWQGSIDDLHVIEPSFSSGIEFMLTKSAAEVTV